MIPLFMVAQASPSPAAYGVLLALGEVEVHVSEDGAKLLARDFLLVVRIEVLKKIVHKKQKKMVVVVGIVLP